MKNFLRTILETDCPLGDVLAVAVDGSKTKRISL